MEGIMLVYLNAVGDIHNFLKVKHLLGVSDKILLKRHLK
jgi:hypothetical protein